ncbi:hypothetical protein HDIA_0285 [Hartmannibacter diazotrophicus]|uniref:TNase-like domain-containing protein n=1 Tax=Hartmannibacter diazotrophicus TaxID=1482074 RepID=A0A2C9D0Q6_9HYPH|nr:hypothetical protein HDIA_0285 [Hartmannibacter diazotrophicus]
MHSISRALCASLFCLSVLLAGGESSLARERLAGPVPADVIKVIDGDTLLVRARVWIGTDVTIKVRLRGVDAPEMHARCTAERTMAEAATRRLGDLVSGGPVSLFDISGGKYGGRVIAGVLAASGRSVAEDLLRDGFVRHYQGKTREPWC